MSVLGLHGYASEHPGKGLFADFHSSVMEIFAALEVNPTYLAAEGEGYSGEFVKASGRTHQKLETTGFDGVSVLSIAANPAGSDEPSYDSFAIASLSFIESSREVTLSFVVNEGLMPFGGSAYRSAVIRLAGLFPWFGGYGFADDKARQPEMFVVGLDGGKLSPIELKQLRAWYAAPVENRMQRIRDIYPWNLLTEVQLNREIDEGVSLGALISKDVESPPERLTAQGLYLWRVREDRLEPTRERLLRQGLIVA